VLLSNLKASASPHVPSDVMSDLRQQASTAAQQSLAQIAELRRLSRHFTRAGLHVLVLKGVVLSAQLFGNPALRYPRDIDLLVDPAEFATAEELLLKCGYRRIGPTLLPRQRTVYQRWIKETAYLNAQTGTLVELHHRFSDNPALIRCEFFKLWEDRDQIEVAGAIFAGLPRGQLPIYLCAHGASHCWAELRWLVDFAASVREAGAIDRAVEMAEVASFGPPMLHAVMLAHDWLGLPVDEHFLTRARTDRRVIRLHRILSRFYSGDVLDQSQRTAWLNFRRYSLWLRLYRYFLKTEWRYLKYQALREFISPADWDTVRLPDSLFWLFPLVRPIGWLVRRWRH